MRILVTGAIGFVGGHLAAAASEAGHEIIEANRSVCDFESGEWSVRERMQEAIERAEPEALIHLAGPPPTSDETRCDSICVDGTKGLLSAIDNTKRDLPLVVAGSAAEIGTFDSPRRCVDENAETHPDGAYGRAKLAQSELVLDWGGTSMRLFNSTGPGQGPAVVVGRIVAQLAAGTHRLVVRESRSVRDFVDVRDAVNAFLMATQIEPGLYNICSGRPVSIAEIISIALDAAGVPGLEVEVEDPDFEGRFVCGDPSLLESKGFKRQFTLEMTIRDSIDSATRALAHGAPTS